MNKEIFTSTQEPTGEQIMNDNEVKAGSVFKHVNGFLFKVYGIGYKNDTNPPTPVVVHEGLHDGRIWIRDLANFSGFHASGVKRFHLIS